jgi:hypothetical protein
VLICANAALQTKKNSTPIAVPEKDPLILRIVASSDHIAHPTRDPDRDPRVPAHGTAARLRKQSSGCLSESRISR